jgi:biopolymer transport protein ExbD
MKTKKPTHYKTSEYTLELLRGKSPRRSQLVILMVAPWLNLILLLLLFGLIERRLILHPAINIQLPRITFTDGIQSSMIMVLLARPTPTPNVYQEIVFFDSKRYLVKDKTEMQRLQESLAHASKIHREPPPLLILADERVSHGTIMRLCEMAREVGITTVSMGGVTEE